MTDPLSEVVRLLRPRAAFANVITGKGNWAVRYTEYGLPSFCIVLDGSCELRVDGHEPIAIGAGDFVLLPTTPAFTLSSFVPAPPVQLDPLNGCECTPRATLRRAEGPSGHAFVGRLFPVRFR